MAGMTALRFRVIAAVAVLAACSSSGGGRTALDAAAADGSASSGGGAGMASGGGAGGGMSAGGVGGGSAGGVGGSPVDAQPASCESTFEAALDRRCATADDCALVMHSDCCGNVVTGVAKGSQAAFTAAESAYFTCVPGCGSRGCFHADRAEVGGTPGVGQTIVPVCKDQRCSSMVSPPSAMCMSDVDCRSGRLCVTFVTNVGPSSTTRLECRDNPCGAAPVTCACAGSLCTGATRFCSGSGIALRCEDGKQ